MGLLFEDIIPTGEIEQDDEKLLHLSADSFGPKDQLSIIPQASPFYLTWQSKSNSETISEIKNKA